MSPHNRNSGKEPVSKGDRSWALRAFFLASILWIASVSAGAVYLGISTENPSRLGLIVYGTLLISLIVLAMTAGGYAVASLVTGRRGKRISWTALGMVTLPLLWCLGLLIKLVLELLS